MTMTQSSDGRPRRREAACEKHGLEPPESSTGPGASDPRRVVRAGDAATATPRSLSRAVAVPGGEARPVEATVDFGTRSAVTPGRTGAPTAATMMRATVPPQRAGLKDGPACGRSGGRT